MRWSCSQMQCIRPIKAVPPTAGSQKIALKASSGRGRLNIQGALDLETFNFTFVEAEKINALTTKQMLEKLERNNPTMAVIHVYMDNARYHHASVLQPWLNSSERKIKLHFLPSYAPHLNPIERLWGEYKRLHLPDHVGLSYIDQGPRQLRGQVLRTQASAGPQKGTGLCALHRTHHFAADQHTAYFRYACADFHQLGVTEKSRRHVPI